MNAFTARPIASDEAELLLRTLERAPLEVVSSEIYAQVPKLIVVEVCECGCRTIYFQSARSGDRQIADGVAYMPSGGAADVMVWASGGNLTALDIVDYGATGELPNSKTVCAREQLHQGNTHDTPV